MTDDLLGGRYLVGDIIGRGGLGQVRRATDVVLDRDVAIKSLRSDLQEDHDHARRMGDEARAAAALTHPNAVVLFDVLDVEGETHLVMELVDGPPLTACLQAGRLPVELVALVGRDVASALAAAHVRGLVHRDVKPSNMLVSRDGIVKLSDFGIARLLASTETRITRVGTVIGSAAYLSPEQLVDQDVDGRADVYALGLVLGEIATGSLGFGEGTTGEVLMRRLHQEPSRPSARIGGLPRDLDDLLVAMTSREPDDRPAAAEVAGVLTTLVPGDARSRLAALVPAKPIPADELAPTELLSHHDQTTRMIDPGTTAYVQQPASGPAPTRHDETAVMSADELEAEGFATDAETDDAAWQNGLPTVEGSLTPPLQEAVSRARDAYEISARFGDPVLRKVIFGALALIGIVVIIALLANSTPADDNNAAAGGSPDEEPAASATDQPAPAAFTFVSGTALDPLGDGGEHNEDIPALFDGNPETQWQTESYRQSNLGGKPGVGFALDLGTEQELLAIDVVLLSNEVDLEVWVSTEDPAGRPAPDVGEKVGSEKKADAGTLTFDVEVRARWVMIWIKRVGGGRAEIGEVSVR